MTGIRQSIGFFVLCVLSLPSCGQRVHVLEHRQLANGPSQPALELSARRKRRPNPPFPTQPPRSRCVTGASTQPPGSVYYVELWGSDALPGTAGQPFRTVFRGACALQDGDTLRIGAGTFQIPDQIPIQRKQRVSILGSGMSATILDGGVEPNFNGRLGSIFRNCFRVGASQDIRFADMTIQRCDGNGIMITDDYDRSRKLTVQRVDFNRNGRDSILSGYTSEILVENCRISRHSEHGLYLGAGGDRITVRGNLFTDNYSFGLQINAVASNGDFRPDPDHDGLGRDCLIEDNIFLNTRGAINLAGVENSVIRNNLIIDDYRGIHFWHNTYGAAFSCKRNKVVNNTFVYPPGKGSTVFSFYQGGGRETEIRDNIIVFSGPESHLFVDNTSNLRNKVGPNLLVADPGQAGLPPTCGPQSPQDCLKPSGDSGAGAHSPTDPTQPE